MTQPRLAPSFPFTAIVGQTAMKRALLLNAVNPRVGGALIRGKKGTAKSTAVRSLAALLPQVAVVTGCPYSCPPEARQGLCQYCQPEAQAGVVSRPTRIVDLPVGATEDRLVGSLDIEAAIKTGSRSFEPGLIAAAHRGILYIDEVNLLNDHLVDVLLDAAAMSRNYVEREGISVTHAAEFILVGTMNPEEGDLRPQLLDRFGLAVEVDGVMEPAERREVVKRRIAFEQDPFGFIARWQAEEEKERQRLRRAQELLPRVQVAEDILELITDICAAYQVDGLRGDIVMYKTASAIAAYAGRAEATAEDVREAAQLALLHRQRKLPFQQPQLVTEQLDSLIDQHQQQQRQREPEAQDNASQEEGDADPAGLDNPQPPDDASPPEDQQENKPPAGGAGPQEQVFETGSPFSVRSLQLEPPDHRARLSTGRRAKTVSGSAVGRYVGARVPQGPVTDLALDATIRAAAPRQLQRRAALAASISPEGRANLAFLIESWDVREKQRETKTGSLILFVVDASGSMGAQRRMVAVKGAILSLLLDAYQRRDRVALVCFRGTGAQLLLPPTNSVDLAQVYLQSLPTGGRTPLGRGLYLALETIEAEKLRDRQVLPLVVLLSDGRANVTLDGQPAGRTGPGGRNAATEEIANLAGLFAEKRVPALVIDTELDFIKLGLAQAIAQQMGARYARLDDLRAETLANTVRGEIWEQAAVG